MAACVGAVVLMSAADRTTQSALYSSPVATSSNVATVGAAVPVSRPVFAQRAAGSTTPMYSNVDDMALRYEPVDVNFLPEAPSVSSPFHGAGVAALSMSFLLAIAGVGLRALSFFQRPAPGLTYVDMTQTDDYAMAAYAGSANERKRGRICYLLGKTDNRKARSISFSHIRNKRVQKVNLQWRRLYWKEGNCWVRLRLSTKGIKTITKYGLDKAARKFGLNLNLYRNGSSGRNYKNQLTGNEAKAAALRTNTCADTITYKTKWSESVRFMEDKPKVTTMAATNEEPQEIAMMISHGKKLAKLSKPADQRKALMRALTTELLRHGRIKTNVVRAKAMRKHVDHMITLAKDGSLHARRQAMGYIYDKQLVHALFESVPERYGDREGGYTRIFPTNPRRGDNTKMCYIELV